MAQPSPRGQNNEPVGNSLAWLLLVIALVWLAPLGLRSLVAPDEGRYADLALYVWRSGDWVTPRLNGLLYFEKPPLVYWAGALAYHLFGANEFAARLWAGLAGLGCVGAVAWAARAWWGCDAAVRGTAICASMTWLPANSHFLNLDTSLTLGTTLALCGVLRAFAPDAGASTRRRAILIAWAGMALATLSKGPIGIVIPGAGLVIYSLLGWIGGERDRVALLWRQLEWLRGPALFLLLTAPWFIAVTARNPGFADFFFIHEHWLRYTTTVHHRTGHWWYFVPFVLIGALPWTSLVITAAVGAARTPRGNDASAFVPGRWLWGWCGFVFVFFSLSGSKLPSYILPMFPALALLVTAGLAAPQRLARHTWLLPLAVWGGALVLWAGAPLLKAAQTPAAQALLLHGAAAALVFGAGAAVAWTFSRRERMTPAIVALALAHLAALLIAMQGHDAFGRQKNAADIAPKISAAVPPGAPVFSIRMHDHTLPFYLQRDVILVDFVDEFEFGQRAEPQHSIATLPAFIERWNALPAGAALMRTDTFAELARAAVPMREIYRDARRVVVVRR